jgi:hypothetical protein
MLHKSSASAAVALPSLAALTEAMDKPAKGQPAIAHSPAASPVDPRARPHATRTSRVQASDLSHTYFNPQQGWEDAVAAKAPFIASRSSELR